MRGLVRNLGAVTLVGITALSPTVSAEPPEVEAPRAEAPEVEAPRAEAPEVEAILTRCWDGVGATRAGINDRTLEVLRLAAKLEGGGYISTPVTLLVEHGVIECGDKEGGELAACVNKPNAVRMTRLRGIREGRIADSAVSKPVALVRPEAKERRGELEEESETAEKKTETPKEAVTRCQRLFRELLTTLSKVTTVRAKLLKHAEALRQEASGLDEAQRRLDAELEGLKAQK